MRDEVGTLFFAQNKNVILKKTKICWKFVFQKQKKLRTNFQTIFASKLSVCFLVFKHIYFDIYILTVLCKQICAISAILALYI